MKKAKEYRKELEALSEDEMLNHIVEVCQDFLDEYGKQVKTKGYSEKICSGILRELDNKFMASIPEVIIEQRTLFRDVIIESYPQIKTYMMW